MIVSAEPKARRRFRTPRGNARGNVIMSLEIDKNERRSFWCSSLPFDPANLDKVGMRLKVGSRTFSILYLLDAADEKTGDWGEAVTARAICEGEYFTLMLQENVYVWVTDKHPVVH